MNTPYEIANNMARAICGMKPTFSRPIKEVTGSTADVTFLGFDLVVELDFKGDIEGILNAADGQPCGHAFQPWALDEIRTLAHLNQLDAP